MAKVSFYLFEKSQERQADIACRLCRKILRHPAKIWLYSSNLELQKQLDELLWSFDSTSFIPHGIQQTDAAVCISENKPVDTNWIIFNFDEDAFDPPSEETQIIEIVENNESAKIIGRKKFLSYRQFGIEPQTYKL